MIHCDSMVTFSYDKNPKYDGKTKHNNTRYQSIQDMVAYK